MKLNKNFILLLLGQSLANMGDILYIVGVISVVYKVTESASVSAFIPFTITSAMFTSSLLTPIVIGKWNLKMLLFGSQVGKTILLLVLAITLMSTASYLWLFPIIASIAFLDGCANPIRQTLIPHYVEKEHLLGANGIAESVTQTIQKHDFT